MLLLPTILVLSLVLFLPFVRAAFTRSESACWRRNCVVQTDAGTLCFESHDNDIEHKECADGFLKNLTEVHLTSTIGRSIVYYDDRARVLGAATWAVPPTMADSVFVCMTGRLVDDPKQYRTVCRKSHGDDDMDVAAAHVNECVSDKKPRYLSDGCFTFGKLACGGGDEHKEWYEQPVVAGVFWVLGVLATLGTIYLWGGAAVRVIQARLAARRRTAVGPGIDPSPPSTRLRAVILPAYRSNSSGRRPNSEAFTLDDRTTTRPSGSVGEEVNRG